MNFSYFLYFVQELLVAHATVNPLPCPILLTTATSQVILRLLSLIFFSSSSSLMSNCKLQTIFSRQPSESHGHVQRQTSQIQRSHQEDSIVRWRLEYMKVFRNTDLVLVNMTVRTFLFAGTAGMDLVATSSF